jgi:hypothetical protein
MPTCTIIQNFSKNKLSFMFRKLRNISLTKIANLICAQNRIPYNNKLQLENGKKSSADISSVNCVKKGMWSSAVFRQHLNAKTTCTLGYNEFDRPSDGCKIEI